MNLFVNGSDVSAETSFVRLLDSSTVRGARRRRHVSPGDRRRLCIRQRGKIGGFGGDHPAGDVRAVFRQVFDQDVDGTAMTGSMSDQHDFVGGYQSVGHLQVKRTLLRYAITLIVRLMTMHQMMMIVMGVVWLDVDLVRRPAVSRVAKQMCGMVIDDDDHPCRVCSLDGRGLGCGRLQEFPQSRHFLDTELGVVGPFEQFTLLSDHEREFLSAAAMRHHLAQMSDQFDGIRPMHAARQSAMEQVLLKRRQLVMEMLAHARAR